MVLVLVAGALPLGDGYFRGVYPDMAGARAELKRLGDGGFPVENTSYWGIFYDDSPAESDLPTPGPARDWSALRPSTRRRYERSRELRRLAMARYGSGKHRITPEDAVRRWYEEGYAMQAGRGNVGTPEHPGRRASLSREDYAAQMAAMRRGRVPAAQKRVLWRYSLYTKGSKSNSREQAARWRGVAGSEKRIAYNARRRRKYAAKRSGQGKGYRPRH